ncbi:MAG TPA: PLP-dependent aspartate aminotransferase family protein [Streptosporangiaceae bacterium]|nr:PLP-dependent aspartate aminotransferase family protein [Streptosporangiaceae bacterium]
MPSQPSGTASQPPGLHPHTTLITAGRPADEPGQPLNVPIVLASNFRAGEHGQTAGREYSRDDATPGWEALEEVVGELEGGEAVAFSSGMAAAAAVLGQVPARARLVAPTDCYAGVQALLADGQRQGRWQVDLVDITDTAAAVAAARRADMVWLESPTNPLLGIADLPAVCAAARESGALVVVDNTFATPLLQQPIALGAHIAVHSATKFLGGHSDLLLGVAVAGTAELGRRLRRRREVSGAVPGALETFLVLRGLRTLALRLDRSQGNATELARRLADHPAVTRVRYPGLPDDPGHARAAAQMTGYGAVLAFEVAGAAEANWICDSVRVIRSATSLGGVESTIERRAKVAGQHHLPPGLLRLSVGCEHIEDLWNDLTNALAATHPDQGDAVSKEVRDAVSDGGNGVRSRGERPPTRAPSDHRR